MRNTIVRYKSCRWHGNTEDQAPIDVVAAGKTEHGDDAAEGKKETEDDGGDGVQETDAAG